MPEEDDEVEKKTVDIIIATAENIEYRNQLDNYIIPQVVPKGMKGVEDAGIAICITGRKNIGEIFFGVG